jgi:hypothetical protein
VGTVCVAIAKLLRILISVAVEQLRLFLEAAGPGNAADRRARDPVSRRSGRSLIHFGDDAGLQLAFCFASASPFFKGCTKVD